MTEFWQTAQQRLDLITSLTKEGSVLELIGLTILARIPGGFIGEICHLYPEPGASHCLTAKIVGFRQDAAILMGFGSLSGVRFGSRVVASGQMASVAVSAAVLGRMLDASGVAIDQGPPLQAVANVSLFPPAISPLARAEIAQVFSTGIKAIDALLTIGKGQRMGLFANAGLGKSSLLNQICRHRAEQGDLVVLALIGERGREVQECHQRLAQSGALSNAVIICATAEQSPLERIQALYTALAVAEYFSQQQQDVTLIVDSMTRFAMALRDVGLAVGEAPTLRGYTSSVFSVLPGVIERCGAFSERGAITGIFSVLVEGELQQDPAADAMKAVLDGHLVLSAQLAERDHYPAIDVLKSVSRLYPQLSTPNQRAAARRLRQVWSRYEEQKHMLALGLGEGSAMTQLKADIQRVFEFVIQSDNQSVSFDTALQMLGEMALESAL